MKASKFNFLLPLADKSSLVVNTFSGAIDILPQGEPSIFGQYTGDSAETTAYLSERGYLLADDLDELEMARRIYRELGKVHFRQKAPHAVLLLTWNCNIQCSYCWQQEKIRAQHPANGVMTLQQVDLACEAITEIERRFAAEKQLSDGVAPSLENQASQGSPGPTTVQLFGGEPLLAGQESLVERALQQCQKHGWHSQITTNGVNLGLYAQIIRNYRVNEIQITVDGPREVHDRRRKGSRYDEIMENIDNLIQDDQTVVKLRVNVDLSNLDSLPALTDDIIDRQWYTSRKFYPYIAPLRDSQPDSFPLMRQRGELLAAWLDLKDSHPKVRIFNLLGWGSFQAVQQFIETGHFPYPRPYVCDASVNQFVFNPAGEVHLCVEEAHDSNMSVGCFEPHFSLNEFGYQTWHQRLPIDVPYCHSCALMPVCGGGCQLWLQNGQILPHFCHAMQESFAIGFNRAFARGELVENSPD